MRLDDAIIEKWRWRARCDPQPRNILDEQGSEAAEVFHLRIGRILVTTNSQRAITRRVPRTGDVLDRRRPDT